MYRIKDGVTIDHFKTELLEALLLGVEVFRKFNYDLVVTSLSDGKHMDNSLHYRGYAADLRTRDMRVQDVPTVAREYQNTLGRKYQVVTEGDHLHVEYDPDHDGGKALP